MGVFGFGKIDRGKLGVACSQGGGYTKRKNQGLCLGGGGGKCVANEPLQLPGGFL